MNIPVGQHPTLNDFYKTILVKESFRIVYLIDYKSTFLLDPLYRILPRERIMNVHLIMH